MNATTTPITCTDEQKAEWSDLHKRMSDLADRHAQAEQKAGGWLTWALTQTTFAEDQMEYAQGKALDEARKAVALWAERAALEVEARAHPYTAELQARWDAQA